MSDPLVSVFDDRIRVARWIDAKLAKWQAVRESHAGESVKIAAGHYIDCLLTARSELVGQTKARKRNYGE